MAVLIKGMKMPENCWDCSLLNAKSCPCKNYASALEYTTARHPGCPLVEVPEPHGRMIEAERLKEVFHRNVASGEAFDQLIDIAPTIVPASEEAK